MPAINPRISVTVTPAVEAVLSRLSNVTGQSKSSFIADLLENSMPIFERMATVIEAATQAKDTLKTQTMKDMEEAEARLHQILGVTMDIFDESTAPILEEAKRVQRRARGTRSRPAPTASGAQPRSRPATPDQPPHVTRGSGTPNRQVKADMAPMKTGSNVAPVKESPPKPTKRASKALKPKAGG